MLIWLQNWKTGTIETWDFAVMSHKNFVLYSIWIKFMIKIFSLFVPWPSSMAPIGAEISSKYPTWLRSWKEFFIRLCFYGKPKLNIWPDKSFYLTTMLWNGHYIIWYSNRNPKTTYCKQFAQMEMSRKLIFGITNRPNSTSIGLLRCRNVRIIWIIK